MRNRKILTLASILLLSFPMLTALCTVQAVTPPPDMAWWAHATTDYQILTSQYTPDSPTNFMNDTLMLRNWTWTDIDKVNLTFTVYNKGADFVAKVSLHIYETLHGAFFHAIDAFAENGLWSAEKKEADVKGWHRLIEFTGGPLDPYGSANFTVVFGELDRNAYDATHPHVGFEGDKYYRFVVTESYMDSGSSDQYIYLYADVTPPTVVISEPPNPKTGDYNATRGCGHHYFRVVFTASDNGSGLLNYTIHISPWGGSDAPHDITGTWPPDTPTDTVTAYFDDWAAGTYVITVTVFDRVGLRTDQSHTFEYIQPEKPFKLTPEKGYAALDTWYNSTTGLVESKRVAPPGQTKELGTNVTASGTGSVWGSGLVVTITVRIRTYEDFAAADYEVPVAHATTLSDGSFSTWFVFPKAPRGVYNVTAKSANGFTCAATPLFEVLPEVVYNPSDVIGPAHINVEATGFYRPNVDRNFFTVYILCNNKDSLIGVNSQVFSNWYIDQNGTLANKLSDDIGRYIENGLFWPFMQPGTYNVSLFINAAGSWWHPNETLKDYWEPLTNFEHANTITVEETLSLLIDIKDELDYLKPIIESIDGNVVTLSTTVGNIETTLEELSPVITRIDGNVVTINTVVGQINTTLGGTGLSGALTSIQGDLATIKTDVGNVNGQLPTLTNYTLIVVIFSVIAAIAAIACAFLVYRKIA